MTRSPASRWWIWRITFSLLEVGYVFQLTEVTENTRRGTRGLILPAPTKIRSPNESELLPDTASELHHLGLRPREIVLDGGFEPPPTNRALPDTPTVFIAGRQHPSSRRTSRRLARYRVGSEGRISTSNEVTACDGLA